MTVLPFVFFKEKQIKYFNENKDVNHILQKPGNDRHFLQIMSLFCRAKKKKKKKERRKEKSDVVYGDRTGSHPQGRPANRAERCIFFLEFVSTCNIQ